MSFSNDTTGLPDMPTTDYKRRLDAIKVLSGNDYNKLKALRNIFLTPYTKPISWDVGVSYALNTMVLSDDCFLVVDYDTICSNAFVQNYDRFKDVILLPKVLYTYLANKKKNGYAGSFSEIFGKVLEDSQIIYADLKKLPNELYDYLRITSEEPDIIFASYMVEIKRIYNEKVHFLVSSTSIKKAYNLMKKWPE